MSIRKRILVAAISILAVATVTPAATADRPSTPKDPVVDARPSTGRPIAGAPTLELIEDDGRDRPTNETMGVQASYLPFNFTYDFSTALASRTFWPSPSGQACVGLRGTGSTDPNYWTREIKVEMWNAYGTDTKVGPTVRYSLNGAYHGYCWAGLYPYHEHYFRLTKDWGPSRVWGNGWVSAY